MLSVAAERVEHHALDVVGVHDDVADVASKAQPTAVRRGREGFVRRHCR